MDNKLSELSKPVAEVVSKFGDLEAFGEREIKLLTGIQQMAYGTKFYSQEYVSALLADRDAFEGAALALRDELREVRAELEATESRLHEVATACATAEQRVAELESDLGLKHVRAVEEALIFATDRNSELEAKLEKIPKACDGKEQDAFIKFALNNKFSTECHPLHFLFLDKQTSAARRAWGAAIAYCRDTVEGDE